MVNNKSVHINGLLAHDDCERRTHCTIDSSFGMIFARNSIVDTNYRRLNRLLLLFLLFAHTIVGWLMAGSKWQKIHSQSENPKRLSTNGLVFSRMIEGTKRGNEPNLSGNKAISCKNQHSSYFEQACNQSYYRNRRFLSTNRIYDKPYPNRLPDWMLSVAVNCVWQRNTHQCNNRHRELCVITCLIDSSFQFSWGHFRCLRQFRCDRR